MMFLFSHRLLAVLCLLTIGFTLPKDVWAQESYPEDALVGLWKAAETNFRPLIRFEHDAHEGLRAFLTMEASEQGHPFAATQIQGDSLFLRLNPSVYFKGTWSQDQGIQGTWTQAELAGTITLTRMDAASIKGPARPQLPQPPFPYTVEEVSFQNATDGIELSGTLTQPKGAGPHPAVVLLSGSGPNSRDYDMNGHKPFLVLADHLTRLGIAVLRYDKRGVAQSQGSIANASLDGFARDATAALHFLRNQSDVTAGKTGLIAHSEGSFVALEVSKQVADLPFLALMTPPSVSGYDVLIEQNVRLATAAGATQTVADSIRISMRQFFDVLRANTDSTTAASKVRALLKKQGLPDQHLQSIVAANTMPWFRDLVRYDPQPALRNMDLPMLVLFGKKDLFVSPEQNEQPMRAALAKNVSSNVTIRVLDDLNHWLQPADTGLPQEAGNIETTIAPEVLDILAGWVHNQVFPE